MPLNDIVKGGWHPKGKDGGRESFRRDFNGINQVAGWMGKGRAPSGYTPEVEAARQHNSAPLSTLKDPASFGPPPKHVAYYGGQTAEVKPLANSAGLGAAPPRPNPQVEAVQEEEEEEKAPPPYRVNTTGIDPDSLPKPPVRRLEEPELWPTAEAYSTFPSVQPSYNKSLPIKKEKPAPPPRLPARHNSHPETNTPEPPATYPVAARDSPAYSLSHNNKGASDRLAKAGVSVPGFDLGRTKSSTAIPHATTSSSTSATPAATAPTTWAQKKTALNTAAPFHKDPTSVSLTDVRSSAATANSFRERHGEQAKAWSRSASDFNQKYNIVGTAEDGRPDDKAERRNVTTSYGITDRLKRFNSGEATGVSLEQQTSSYNKSPRTNDIVGVKSNTAIAPSQNMAIGKKPPPPLPPKKPALAHRIEMLDNDNIVDAPPPVPIASKPR